MIHRPVRTATAIAAGVVAAAVTVTPSPAAAEDFGQHVRNCAQTHGFDGTTNPGTHQGAAGWDPSHVCH